MNDINVDLYECGNSNCQLIFATREGIDTSSCPSCSNTDITCVAKGVIKDIVEH